MKIAIIECDIPMPELVEKFGNYTGYFKTLLNGAVTEAMQDKLEFVSYEAYLNKPLPKTAQELEGIDGIVLSGSKYTSYDNDAWILATLDFIRFAYKKVKIAGICFGHQLIARALGGEVALNPKGWEISVTSTSTFSCELLPTLKALRLHQMHRDIVTKAPPGGQVVGSNDICEIQVLYEPGRYFSVQGHPEFNQTTIEMVTQLRIDQGKVPVEYGRDAIRRADQEHDGSLVARAILQFFKEKAY